MNGDTQINSNSGGSGSLIGSIIVVIVLIAGAIWLFSNKANAPAAPTTSAPATTEAPVSPAGGPASPAPAVSPSPDTSAAGLDTLDQQSQQAAASLNQDLSAPVPTQ